METSIIGCRIARFCFSVTAVWWSHCAMTKMDLQRPWITPVFIAGWQVCIRLEIAAQTWSAVCEGEVFNTCTHNNHEHNAPFMCTSLAISHTHTHTHTHTLSLSLSRKGSQRVTKSVFSNKAVQQSLKDLHEKYVITTADKAGNNVVFICKNYYHEKIRNELGARNETIGNSTYRVCPLSTDSSL